MSSHEFAAGMLAWRRALEARHPQIAAAVSAELTKWLQVQRQEPADVSKPLLIVLAHVSCLEDLNAQVGIAQMVAFSDLRCSIVLTLPTQALTGIARQQARRNGWGGLLTIIEAEPSPAKRTKREAWPAAEQSLGGAASPAKRLSIPALGVGDELIVRTAREPFHSDVIERRPARLLSASEPFAIRLPGNMLGPAPRMVRVEAHKPDGTVVGDRALVQVLPSQLEPWMISCFLNRGGGGNPVVRAFANAIGARLAYAEDEPPVLQDISVVWGVLRDSDRILAQAKAQSLYWFYIDHAYFDRGHRRSYRITRNRYEAGAIRRCPSDRIAELGIDTRPWRKGGREIIVCPPTDYFMQAHGSSDWLETTLATLKSVTDRPVIVREKPKEGETAVPLPTALETAHALVTHSSNVAIEAVCLGTPVFVALTSAAAPVGLTDLSKIEEPVYPDRDEWLSHLAYNQYSFEEIADGRAWKMLLELEERELA
jgi:hypothetical protein